MKNRHIKIICFIIIISVFAMLITYVKSPDSIYIRDEQLPLGSDDQIIDAEPHGDDIIERQVPVIINDDGELQINITDFGAIGDGAADNSKAIQDAIYYAHIKGIRDVIIPEGHFMVSLSRLIGGKFGRYTAISLYSNVNVLLNENAIIEAFPTDKPNYAIFNLVECSSVKIDGGTIIGERRGHVGNSGEHGMGINVFKCKDITISNISINDCWGDGIYIGGLDNTQINENVLVTNVEISNCRRQGISVTTGEGIVIRDSTIRDINGTPPQSGIDVETNWPDTPVKNITIENNIFFNNVMKDIVLGGNCENVVIQNNNFAENTLNVHQIAINLVNGNNVTVSDNTITGRIGGVMCRNNYKVDIVNNTIEGYTLDYIFQGVGIELKDNARNVYISNNKMKNLNKGFLVVGNVKKVMDITITDNYIENIQTDGYFGYQPINNLVFKNNKMKNVVERYGMLIKGGDSINIDNNIIEDCGNEYIYITKGKSITIQNNEFTDYGRTDAKNFIAILANVENCKVISNTFDSSDNKKRVVEASWITKNPVTIENNIALYTKTPFYTVDTHNISNNATAAEGLIISKKEVYIEGLGINE